jgi:ribonuclease HI
MDLMKGLYLLRIDGAKKASSVGESVSGAFAFILRDPKDRPVEGWSKTGTIDRVRDPHSAEYEALLAGLAFARARGIEYIAVFSDSRAAVNQVNGLWSSSAHLADYCERAKTALSEFKGWQLSWVPRDWNKDADDLVGEALNASEEQVIHATD